MGLFVVSRARGPPPAHGPPAADLRVTRPNQGVTVSVHIPDTLLVSPLEMPQTGPVPRVGTAGLPQVTIVHSGEMPQLVAEPARQEPVPAANPASALPRRTPGATELPRRTPGATELPRRTPGAAVPAPLPVDPAPVHHAPEEQYSPPPTPPPAQAPAPLPPVSEPAAPAFGSTDSTESPGAQSVDITPPARRHRYRRTLRRRRRSSCPDRG